MSQVDKTTIFKIYQQIVGLNDLVNAKNIYQAMEGRN